MRRRTARQGVAGPLILVKLRAELHHRRTGGHAGCRQCGLQGLAADARVAVAECGQETLVGTSLCLELLTLQFDSRQSGLLTRQRVPRPVSAGALAKRRDRLPRVGQERIVDLELGLEELAASCGLLLRVFGARALEEVDHPV